LFVRYSAFFVLVVTCAHAAELHGKVTSVVGGEPLAQVQVSVLDTNYQAVTSRDGTFKVSDVKVGDYNLRFEAVGYRLVTVPLSVTDGTEVKEFDVNLAPDNFRRTDKVEVQGDLFQHDDPITVNEVNLTNSEMKEASTVLADDPFRAVQSLPGVSAAGNNELFAEFSVDGTPFQNVGVYLDDVLIPGPFHNVPNTQNGASLSLLTSETIQEMKLLPAAYPQKFGDDVGAALEIHTREGSRTPPSFRAAAGLADSEFLGEGRLGSVGKGSWLASARKSYIGWLVRNRVGSNFSDISFYDGDLKLSYDVAPGQNLTLYALAGHTNVEVAQPPDPTDLKHASEDFYFGRLGWRWTISPQLQLDSRAAYIREPLAERFAGGNESHNTYQEWTAGSNLVWNWRKEHLLESGWTLRRLSDAYPWALQQPNGSITYFIANPVAPKGDVYAQQSSSLFKNHLHLLGGIRYDSLEGFPPHPFSPQGAAAVQIARAVELQFSYGRYTQYQFLPFQALTSCTVRDESWQTADHYVATLEWRAAENSRVRLHAFDRRNASLFHTDPVSCPGVPIQPGQTFTYQHNYSRGAQVIFQRRSANRSQDGLATHWSMPAAVTYCRIRSVIAASKVRTSATSKTSGTH
jgi:hypothetical protein